MTLNDGLTQALHQFVHPYCALQTENGLAYYEFITERNVNILTYIEDTFDQFASMTYAINTMISPDGQYTAVFITWLLEDPTELGTYEFWILNDTYECEEE